MPEFPEPNSETLTVVVENNTADLIQLSRLLKSYSGQVVTVQNADDGLALIETMNPNLVMANVDLACADGVPLIQKIRSHAKLAHTPAIALAAATSATVKAGDGSTGYNAWIGKPLEPDRFKQTIAELFGGATPVQPLPVPNLCRKARVLIVDNEAMNLKLFKAYLASEAYDIVTAENGQGALSSIAASPPDVILLDIMMPVIDGFEITRLLKGSPETAGIPIILMTARSGRENKSAGLDAGADEFITKPVQRTELVARVRSMLRMKRFEEQIKGRQRSEDALSLVQAQPAAGNEIIQNVLVAEDNDTDALLLLRQLELEPYTIKRVSTGEAAIREVLNEPIDLVLLDLMLPGIDGFEVCRRIKGDDRTRNIQIVMMTSMRDLDCRVQSAELGTDDYLVKPVNPRELRARVQALLKKKRYIDKLHNRYEQVLNRAISDDLTGLFNHGYFKRFLELEIKRSLRQKHPIALLLMDLDDFKKINDTLGHLTGDRILVKVAKSIKANIRDVDFAARYGGEEFAVILPYAGIDDVKDISERIRRSIAKTVAVNAQDHDALPVTVSIGAALSPYDASTVDALIRKADEMMYLAKQCGKNQVCVSSDFKG